MSQENSSGIDGACKIFGFVWAAASDWDDMRQYVPPKCIVRRLRSVRQVHLVESFRKERISCSSAGLMKSWHRVKPGTLLPLTRTIGNDLDSP